MKGGVIIHPKCENCPHECKQDSKVIIEHCLKDEPTPLETGRDDMGNTLKK